MDTLLHGIFALQLSVFPKRHLAARYTVRVRARPIERVESALWPDGPTRRQPMRRSDVRRVVFSGDSGPPRDRYGSPVRHKRKTSSDWPRSQTFGGVQPGPQTAGRIEVA